MSTQESLAEQTEPVKKKASLAHRLYTGDVSPDIVGRRKTWYIVSGVILLLAIGGLLFRGLNLGVEFKGGAEFAVPASTCTVEQVRAAVSATGTDDAIVTQLGSNRVRVQTPELTEAESKKVTASLASACKVSAGEIRVQLVGASWGGEITKKALTGLLVFIIAVSIFLSIYFEWRMALAAVVALIHDLLITVGIYALVGFEVTPATVIGLLTILGFSLYDTVVVFDKVKENTRGITGQSRLTYSEAANLAVDQTIIRSINTSVVALLPVAAILFVGAGLLGAGTLKDLALALFIGTAAGAYSSIFIATPFLCQLKEREPAIQAVDARVKARRASRGETDGKMAVAAAATSSARVAGDSSAAAQTGARPKKDRPHRQVGNRSQPKRTPRSKR